jgi:DNA-binding MarR family transcriptional regulator
VRDAPPVDEVRELVLGATRVSTAIAACSVATLAADVTLPMYRVLVLLEAHGVVQTMTQLARELAVTHSSATRSCDRLVEVGS